MYTCRCANRPSCSHTPHGSTTHLMAWSHTPYGSVIHHMTLSHHMVQSHTSHGSVKHTAWLVAHHMAPSHTPHFSVTHTTFLRHTHNMTLWKLVSFSALCEGHLFDLPFFIPDLSTRLCRLPKGVCKSFAMMVMIFGQQFFCSSEFHLLH